MKICSKTGATCGAVNKSDGRSNTDDPVSPNLIGHLDGIHRRCEFRAVDESIRTSLIRTTGSTRQAIHSAGYRDFAGSSQSWTPDSNVTQILILIKNRKKIFSHDFTTPVSLLIQDDITTFGKIPFSRFVRPFIIVEYFKTSL